MIVVFVIHWIHPHRVMFVFFFTIFSGSKIQLYCIIDSKRELLFEMPISPWLGEHLSIDRFVSIAYQSWSKLARTHSVTLLFILHVSYQIHLFLPSFLIIVKYYKKETLITAANNLMCSFYSAHLKINQLVHLKGINIIDSSRAC